MAEQDYIAQLFHVRRERYGISDDICWGWFDPETQNIEWNTWRHADADGIGGLAKILRPLGFPCSPLPQSNETYEPSWREIIKAGKQYPLPKAPKKVHWKRTYDFQHDQLHLPEVVCFNEEDTARIVAQASVMGASAGNFVFAALSRVVAEQLIADDAPFHWFIPVNVRGACGINNEFFNQASGINLMVTGASQASDWQAQTRRALNAKRHWATWKLVRIGRYIGSTGLSWVYRLSSRSTHFAGSCSNLGRWPLTDVNNPPLPDRRVLVAVGPGTANYPINSSVIEWDGRLTITLKIHPYICPDQATIRSMVNAWRDTIIGELPPVSSKKTENVECNATSALTD